MGKLIRFVSIFVWCTLFEFDYFHDCFSGAGGILPVEPFFRLSLTHEYGAYLRGDSIQFPDPRFKELFGMNPTGARRCTYEDLKKANDNRDTAAVLRSSCFAVAYNRLKDAQLPPEA